MNGVYAFAARFGSGTWKRGFGATSTSAAALGVALDLNDNVVLTGQFDTQIDLDCIAGGMPGTLSGPGRNVFTTKRAPDGTCLWSVAFFNVEAKGTGVATDPSGNVFVTGSFWEQIDIPGLSPLIASNQSDVFVTRLDSQGKPMWSIQGHAGVQASAGAIALDPLDHTLLLAGTFTSTLDFDPCPALTGVTAAFVAKLEPFDGKCIWSKAFGASQANAHSVAVDACGNVVITGSFTGDADFGGGTLTSDGGSADVFIAKLDKAGNHVWSQRYGDGGTQVGRAIATALDGRIAVTGDFQGGMNFGDGGLQTTSCGMTCTPTADVFVAVFPLE